jgi:hypothetical protein
MEVHSDWYNRIVKEINLHKDSLSQKDAKKYKLDLLLRVAGRVEEFFSICGQCQLTQPEITRITGELGYLTQMPKQAPKEARKSYHKTLNNIIKHLKKEHKLVTKGYYRGIGMTVGPIIAVAIGAALKNPGIGFGVGIAIGLAIGSYLDKKAEKEGRVI